MAAAGGAGEERANPQAQCVLCTQAGGAILWRNPLVRVVLVGDEEHPGFCRVILNAHVREMTDLRPAERVQVMQTVFAVEKVLRELLEPDKMNLASLGNQVPHLHWHLVPRFADDPHFPNPVWGARRGGSVRRLPERFRDRLAQRLVDDLGPAD